MQHKFNALHVYCRLMDLHLRKKWVRWLTRGYERIARNLYG